MIGRRGQGVNSKKRKASNKEDFLEKVIREWRCRIILAPKSGRGRADIPGIRRVFGL